MIFHRLSHNRPDKLLFYNRSIDDFSALRRDQPGRRRGKIYHPPFLIPGPGERRCDYTEEDGDRKQFNWKGLHCNTVSSISRPSTTRVTDYYSSFRIRSLSLSFVRCWKFDVRCSTFSFYLTTGRSLPPPKYSRLIPRTAQSPTSLRKIDGKPIPSPSRFIENGRSGLPPK